MNPKYSNSNSYSQNSNGPFPDQVAFNPILLTISPRHGAMQSSQRDRTPPGAHSSNLQKDRPRKKIFDQPQSTNLNNISSDMISTNSFTKSPRNEGNRSALNISYQQNNPIESAPDRPRHPFLGPQAQHTRYIAAMRDLSPDPQPNAVNANKPTLSISPKKPQMPQQSNIRGSVFESFAQDGYFVPQSNHKLTSPSSSSTITDSMKGSINMFGSIANPFAQPQSFYVDGATHPDLDTSYASSVISHTSRRRIKPIVVMNINIGNGKKEEIRVHEGDDPVELANAFCRSYNLPRTLVQVLANNIMGQVNNYYALKAQKNTPNKPTENFQPSLHPQTPNQNYNPIENDPRMSERVSHNRPQPHSCPQNPALEESGCQHSTNLEEYPTQGTRRNRYPEDRYQRCQTSPGRNGDDDFGLVTETSRRHEKPRTNSDFEDYEDKNENRDYIEEKEDEDSASDADEAQALKELEEQIKKLQQKKEKYLSKKPELKNHLNKSSTVSKSYVKDNQRKETQAKVASHSKPVNTRNVRENVRDNLDLNKQVNKTRKSPLKNQALGKIDTNIRQINKEALTPKHLQNTAEKVSHRRDQSPQNLHSMSKSPMRSPLTKEAQKTTPKNATSTQIKSEFRTGSMLLPENKMSLKSNEDSDSRMPGQRKGYNQSVKVDFRRGELAQSINVSEVSEEDELKVKVLADIFKSLDDDFDGSISIDHVDISSFDEKVLDSMSEILEALEAGMVLTFKDFCNIVNHRKLLDALKKKYGTRISPEPKEDIGSPERNKFANFEVTEKPFHSPKESAASKDSLSTAHDSKVDGEYSLSSTLKEGLKVPSFEGYGDFDLSNRYLQNNDRNFGKKTYL